MSDSKLQELATYLTKLLIESKDLTQQTPDSIVKLYKETYKQVLNSINNYKWTHKANWYLQL